MMRRSATAVIERNITWAGPFSTEPWEVAWAREAIFFVRQLDAEDALLSTVLTARVQISPDGIRWVDEGGVLTFQGRQELAALRVREFGGWLRLAGRVEGGSTRVIVYLSLKE